MPSCVVVVVVVVVVSLECPLSKHTNAIDNKEGDANQQSITGNLIVQRMEIGLVDLQYSGR